MEPPKSGEDIRSLKSKKSAKDVPASNKAPVEQQTTTAPTSINSLRLVMWGIVLMAVLGLLWLVRNMRK
jgi:hypothetical protein